jgi:predicted DNA-binding protein
MSTQLTHKTTSVRLSAEQAAELEDLASFDGVAVAQEIREAIDLLITERRNDPAFRERVSAFAERSARMLERLEGGAELADIVSGGEPASVAVAAARR